MGLVRSRHFMVTSCHDPAILDWSAFEKIDTLVRALGMLLPGGRVLVLSGRRTLMCEIPQNTLNHKRRLTDVPLRPPAGDAHGRTEPGCHRREVMSGE